MQNGEDIGEKVAQRRKALGLSQSELAEFALCGRLFVSQLENGKQSVRLDKLLAILNVLGLELELAEVNRR